MTVSKLFALLKETGTRFFSKDPMTYGASIAFYTLISFPAITLLITMVAGVAYENDGVQDALINQLSRFFGPAGVQQVDAILENAQDLEKTWWAKVIGIGTLIFSATTVFISLQNALNNIWDLKAKPESSVLKYIVNRMLSLAMVVSIGFLLLVTLVIDSVILMIEKYVSDLLSDFGMILVYGVNIVITLFLVSFVFSMIFKYLPDAIIGWKQVRTGGFFTAILFVLGKFLLGFYLTYTDVGSAYGTAGSLVLFLTWVYYSTAILLFGATFTFVYSKNSEHIIKPDKHATFVEHIEVDKTI